MDLDKQYSDLNENRVRFIRIVDYTQNTDDIRYIDKELSNNIINEKDVVIVRYGATAGFVGHGITGVLANNMFTVNPENDVAKDYLYIYLKQDKIYKKLNNSNGSSAMPALNFGTVKDVGIAYPLVAEQEKIGELFTNLDNLITLHQRKFNDILVYKLSTKFLFLKLAKNVWEQRKAKDLCSIITGKSNTQDQVQDGKYPFYIRSDVPVRSNRYLYDEEAVITIGDGNIGRVFHYVNGKFDLHQRCYKMADFKALTAKYFYYYFSTKFYERAMSMTAKATVDSVRLEMISDMEIKFPKSTTEQTNISELLTNLDNLITLHHRKYTYIFYSWEQRKLTSLVEFYNGQTYSPLNVQDKGTLVLRSSNVQNGEISKDDLVFIDSDVVNTNNVEIGDIIVVVRNGSRNLIGKHAQIKEKMTDTVIGAFMTGIRSKNPEFVNSLLNTRIFEDEINKNMGATINQITGYMFSNMEFKIPTNDEQSKIGELFTNLDNLITLHQHKELKRRNDNNEHLRW